MTERIRLFANGVEHEAFAERNCHQCVKAGDAYTEPQCDLLDAIIEAMFGDGTFAPEIVARFGWKPEYITVLGWKCAEFQAEGPVEPRPAAYEMARAGAALLPGLEPADRAPGGGR